MESLGSSRLSCLFMMFLAKTLFAIAESYVRVFDFCYILQLNSHF